MKIKIKNDQNVRESSSSHSEHEEPEKPVVVEKLVFGDQLQDDVMNSFCDKLQLSCPKRIDGFLAIQFLMCDPESAKKHISGKNEAMQILFDRSRIHYVLSHYKPSESIIMIYDSLQLWEQSTGSPIISTELVEYLRCLYSHHFRGGILEIGIDQSYEQQGDDFSCGYRAIGAVVDIARGSSPSGKMYSRNAILELIQKIMHENKPRWDWFQGARIHRNDASSTKSSIYRVLLAPPPPLSTTSTATSASATSIISTASSKSSRRSAAGEDCNSCSTASPIEETVIATPQKVEENCGFFNRRDLLSFAALRRAFYSTSPCCKQGPDHVVEGIDKKE